MFTRDLLASQLSSAESCLQSAAGDSPMYGSLSVVRTLYSTVTVWDSLWEEISRDIIRLCYSIWSTVSCVVVQEI